MARPCVVGVAIAPGLPHQNRPHRLAGQTLKNGQPVCRRVTVRSRNSDTRIVSTVTGNDGMFEFRRLPSQSLGEPYVVTCFDDTHEGFGNALIFDWVYQVDENGLPPQS